MDIEKSEGMMLHHLKYLAQTSILEGQVTITGYNHLGENTLF